MAKRKATKTGGFSIDKGVPLPSATHQATEWPFHELEVGDSFLLVDEDLLSLRYKQNRALNAARSYGHSHPGFRIASRKVSETEVRVWRVA